MAITFGDQGSVDLGRSRVQPVDTYSSVRSVGNEGSGFEELAKSLGKIGVTFEQSAEKAAQEDQRNSEVYAQRLRESLKGGTPTDDDVKNILSDRHSLVRARAAEDYGYLNGLNAANEALRTLPKGLMPEEFTAKSQELLAQAANSAKGNVSYQAGYMRAFNSLIMERSKADGHELATEFKNNALEGMTQRGAVSLDSKIGDFKAGRPVAPPAPLSLRGKQSATPEAVNAIVKTADSLGIDPKILTAAISYETGGTFSTEIMGGKGGAYKGLIQFSPENQKLYGIKEGMSFAQQMDAVGAYLKDRGVKPGMDVLDVYAAINAGRAGNPKLYDLSDGNGTVRSHAARIQQEHLGVAEEFLRTGGWTGGDKVRVASVNPTSMTDATVVDGTPVVDGGAKQAQGGTQVVDASGRVPVVVDTAGGKATLTLSSDPNLRNLQLNIYNDWKTLDAEYGRTSNTTNRERRDAYVNMLRLKAIDNLMPEILDSIPSNLLTNEQQATFLAARNMIREKKEHEENRRYTEAKRREEAAKDDITTKVMKEYKDNPNAFMDPFSSAQYEYIDANGKKQTGVNKDLVTIINGLNAPQVTNDFESQRRAADVNDKFRGAYLSGDWSTFKNDPRMAPLIQDGRVPTDTEVRAYIATMPVNKEEKKALMAQIDGWKDSYKVVNDSALKEQYAYGLQPTVQKYMEIQTLAKKQAQFDENVQRALNELPSVVNKAYQNEYLSRYQEFVKDNKGQLPNEAQKREMREAAEKRANDVFIQQQKIIEKVTGSGTDQAGQTKPSNQPLSTSNVDVTTDASGNIVITRKPEGSQTSTAQTKPETKPQKQPPVTVPGIEPSAINNIIDNIGAYFTLNAAQRDALPELRRAAMVEVQKSDAYKQLYERYVSAPPNERSKAYGELVQYFGSFVKSYVDENVAKVSTKSGYDPKK